jgi:hypothetical protein
MDAGLPGNLGMIYPINMIGGVDLPLTRDQALWWGRIALEAGPLAHGSGKDVSMKAPQPVLLRFMAARIVLATPDGALYNAPYAIGPVRFREQAGAGDVRLLVCDEALPRAYWTPSWRVTVGLAAAMDTLADPAFDASRECVVDALSAGIEDLAANPPPPANETTPARTAATCSVEDVTSERVIIRVNAPRLGITVLADSFAPGWTARLDGVRQPILHVNGLFRGVATPSGGHVIEFLYRPWAFYIGLAISLVTFAPVLAAGLRTLIRKH